MDVTTFRAGKRTGDPNRPKLNDFLIFWLLQDSDLLSGAEHLDRGIEMGTKHGPKCAGKHVRLPEICCA